jgi:hypothetical protein
MQVSIVDTKDIETMWPFIEGYMKKAAKYTYGRFEAEDIKEGLLKNPQQLWVAFNDKKIYGAVVTEVTKYPRMTALTVHFLAGIEFESWKEPMIRLVHQFGKDNGCKLIDSYGRPGWEKVWANYGYTKRFIFYELPLEN